MVIIVCSRWLSVSTLAPASVTILNTALTASAPLIPDQTRKTAPEVEQRYRPNKLVLTGREATLPSCPYPPSALSSPESHKTAAPARLSGSLAGVCRHHKSQIMLLVSDDQHQQ
ncbi:hypothetical protein E6O75_ATG00501 [Venturia nashicola]|uniref:Secreted protein n=1 Tax=Venturia nashicola TaxID=86259 RepID=A0A4Z1PNZ0_9PEZI|nr:hypothetical protein E6O75_ATG00501 [Venturia nashicola]